MADPATGYRLDDPAVESRLSRLDGLLGELERIPGRTAELGVEAIEALLDVYGEALHRVTDQLAELPEVRTALTADELLRHLLLLHHIHPDPPAERVRCAVEDAGRALRTANARIELVEVREDVAVVRVTGCGCGDTATAQDLVRDEVLAAAPEVARVDIVGAEPPLIPLASVGGLTRPVPDGASVAGAGPR